jgi:alkylation response protein AidB-like acyl-CoA dehydrogenase
MDRPLARFLRAGSLLNIGAGTNEIQTGIERELIGV